MDNLVVSEDSHGSISMTKMAYFHCQKKVYEKKFSKSGCGWNLCYRYINNACGILSQILPIYY
jgi:hypothetical protein